MWFIEGMRATSSSVKRSEFRSPKKVSVMKDDLLKRITRDPDICHGKPTVRGLRYPVDMLLDLMASGMTTQEILEDYPDLERDDLMACLRYAARITHAKTAFRLAL